MATRADVVEKARSFIGTPFHPGARIKGRGIDSVGLVLCVAHELGLLDVHGVAFQPDSTVAATDFLHSDLAGRLERKLVIQLLHGDILYLKQHDGWNLAIASTWNGVPYLVRVGPDGTVEHVMNATWRRAAIAAFQFPSMEPCR